MLYAVKTALRIKSRAFDDEVQGIIDACKADLKLAGVKSPDLARTVSKPSDPLIRRAIILYAKAAFNFEDQGERYQKAYDSLKCSFMLAGDYG